MLNKNARIDRWRPPSAVAGDRNYADELPFAAGPLYRRSLSVAVDPDLPAGFEGQALRPPSAAAEDRNYDMLIAHLIEVRSWRSLLAVAEDRNTGKYAKTWKEKDWWPPTRRLRIAT